VHVGARRAFALLLLSGALLGVLSARAFAAPIKWTVCADDSDFACGRLTVPLDPSGATPGTLSLSIRRKPALIGPATSAVVALAGGPGQEAISFSDDFAHEMTPALLSHDLIVFDQRGTGYSGALNCAALAHATAAQMLSSLVTTCAKQIGPSRAFYTTADSVADIEAIRVAAGYSKLVLYGTSYGTKVALDYARAYPQNVESMVLDSTVPPDGPDVYGRSTLQAAPGVLDYECSGNACAGIRGNAGVNLAGLLVRLRHHPLATRVYDGRGRGHSVRVTENDIADMIVAGDLDPFLRIPLPAAVRSALNGDAAPLGRLWSTASGVSDSFRGVAAPFDNPLFLTTLCEELPYPWQRSASPAARLSQARAAFDALPSSSYYPFDSATALYESSAEPCYLWPFASAAPQSSGPPLPNVPTLILSGTDDTRTPTSDARAVAAQIPDAQLVVVPHTGHSVLGSDPGTCSAKAVKSFFTGAAIAPCTDDHALLPPSPVAPTRLAAVPAVAGVGGRAGRTLRAVRLTISDFSLQVAGGILGSGTLSALGGGIGGLRGGWASFSLLQGIVMHGYSYVPGVTLSGSLGVTGAALHVGGSAAAGGTLRTNGDGSMSGTLGGHRVRISPAGALGARIARLGARFWHVP
jgi:pimeloyl-ACP methyl ester carboxylesterase